MSAGARLPGFFWSILLGLAACSDDGTGPGRDMTPPTLHVAVSDTITSDYSLRMVCHLEFTE
jgi:hypothetical protein